MRFAIVGCGTVGRLRARALRSLADARLVAVADPVAASREAVARDFGCRAHADIGDLLAERDIDAVIISTPPALHRAHVVAALGSGRPVFCEKPLATTVADCAEMVAAAAGRSLALATGFNVRHFPAFARAKALVASGAIGDLDYVRAYHGHQGGTEFTQSSVHDRDASGGGTLMDNGIHVLDLVRFFLGDVAEVKGICAQSVWRFPGCEDDGFALLRTAAGRIASLQSSWTEWRGYGFFVEVHGTRGFVRASYPPMWLTVGRAREPGERVRSRHHAFPLLQIRERLQGVRWTTVRSFARELEDFALASTAGRAPSCSGTDGLRAVELADAIYRSSASGETVRLGHSTEAQVD